MLLLGQLSPELLPFFGTGSMLAVFAFRQRRTLRYNVYISMFSVLRMPHTFVPGMHCLSSRLYVYVILHTQSRQDVSPLWRDHAREHGGNEAPQWLADVVLNVEIVKHYHGRQTEPCCI